jgi:hypothetical protein
MIEGLAKNERSCCRFNSPHDKLSYNGQLPFALEVLHSFNPMDMHAYPELLGFCVVAVHIIAVDNDTALLISARTSMSLSVDAKSF